VKPGDSIRLTVSELDDDGAGVGRGAGAGRMLVVPGTLPGEEITARVDALSHHRDVAWGSLLELHRPSPERVAPACAAATAQAGRCGGCVLQILDYPAQLAWKAAALGRHLAQVLDRSPPVAILPVVASPRTLGYRNKSKLVAAEDRPLVDGLDSLGGLGGQGGPGRDEPPRLILGAFAPRSHEVVDLAGCALAEPPLDAVARSVVAAARAHHVSAYDERRRTGTLRHAVLRSSARGAVQVTFVTSTPDFPAGVALAEDLRARHPAIVGVVHNVNASTGNAIWGDVEALVWGAPTLDDEIDGIRLRLSARAFFQANREVAARAYRAIATAIAPTARDTVVDAYAGVGGIALTLARAGAGRVLGIETHAAAVEDATANAASNGLAGAATFVAGDAAACLKAIPEATAVVLNPPRKGCAPAVLAETARLRPRRVAYLSCAPVSLARDLAILHTLGYDTRAITPFDMLPHTPHLEVLAVLERRR
jgi:23S rRNA (uracil1939-C5)-methyltransferase